MRLVNRPTAARVAAVIALAAAASIAGQGQPAKTPRPDYPVQPVPFTARAPRRRVLGAAHRDEPDGEHSRRRSSKCELSGRIDYFVRAAKALRGEELTNKRPPGYPFDDTDLYKVIEGASYTLNVHPDPKLDAYVDDLIAKIAAAQEPDGYLYTTRTIDPKNPHRMGAAGTLGRRARRQPRALQPRAPLRSRGRAPPGDRQVARC